jgi:fatty-acid desaturase
MQGSAQQRSSRDVLYEARNQHARDGPRTVSSGLIRHIRISWELSTLIILGLILLIIGLVAKIGILWTIGIILLVVGVALWILGAAGHAVGGRAHYW